MSLGAAAIATPKQFYQGQPGTADTLLYTAPAADGNTQGGAATAYITEIDISNVGGNSTATFNLYLVPTGQSSAAQYAIFLTSSLTAYDFRPISPLRIYMPAGSMLRAIQSVAGNYNFIINGVEIS